MAIQQGVAPPGWEDTVVEMKKHGEIDNPWALAWWLQDQGHSPQAVADPVVFKGLCERYKAACRMQGAAEPYTLAAAGMAWAQAQLLARRQGQTLALYRETAG